MYGGTFCTVVYFNLVYELGNTKKKKNEAKVSHSAARS